MSRTTADRLDRIERLLEELVALMRIQILGSGERPQPTEPYYPTIPQPPKLDPAPYPTPELRTTCPKCGMDFSGVMGYVCQDPKCPMGCGPITCKAT